MGGYYSLLGRAPSMLDIAQASGMTRAQREARELERQQIERQDEKLKWDREQAIAERDAVQKESQAKALDNEKRTWAGMLQRNPQHADRIGQAAKARGVDLGTLVTPETMQQAQATGIEIEDAVTPEQAAMDLEMQASGRLGPPKPEDVEQNKSSAFSQKLEDAGIPRGTPKHQEMMQRFSMAEIERMEREPRSGGININLGGSDAAPKVKADQQQTLVDAMQTSEMLDELESLAAVKGPDGKPLTDDSGNLVVNFGQFLGANRAKQWTLAQLDKIDMVPDAQRPQFEQAQQFRAVLDKYRSEEYKRLLGSAQSESEIKNLVNSVISADMGSVQFTQAFKALRRATARNERIASKVLREGFDLGSAEYRQRYSEIESGGGGGRSSSRAAPAAQQASDAGLNDYFEKHYQGAP